MAMSEYKNVSVRPFLWSLDDHSAQYVQLGVQRGNCQSWSSSHIVNSVCLSGAWAWSLHLIRNRDVNA